VASPVYIEDCQPRRCGRRRSACTPETSGARCAAARGAAAFLTLTVPFAQRAVSGTGELTPLTATAAGFLTGYWESICVTPFEVIKVRMQVKEHVHRYPSSVACARDVVVREGLRGLYRGLVRLNVAPAPA